MVINGALMVINGALMVINGDLPSGKPGVFWWMINIYDFMGILTEQATVGVRKLQHFLCKDPTAYGATGQN